MPILVQVQRGASHRQRRSHLDFPSEESGYYVVPPSGALRTWSSPLGYLQYTVQTPTARPSSMMQPVTFNDDPDGYARVVRLRPVDEAEDTW